MLTQSRASVQITVLLLLGSLLIALRDLLNASRLPAPALVWTTFAALGTLVLMPLCWRRRRVAFVAAIVLALLTMVATSLNPMDPYFLTHWGVNPVESLLVVLEGYALPLPLIFFAYRAYRDSRPAR